LGDLVRTLAEVGGKLRTSEGLRQATIINIQR
jgi:hypothetical protein